MVGPTLEPRAALGAESMPTVGCFLSCDLYGHSMWRQLGIVWQGQRPARQWYLYQSSFPWASHSSTQLQTLGC